MNFSNFFSTLAAQIAAQHFSEWMSVIFAITYLVLAARGNPWCWIFGIIGCAFWAYAAFELYKLYIDGGLQIFYIAISFLGLYQWKYGGKDKQELPVSRLEWRHHALIWTGGLALSMAVGAFFDVYTNAAATYLNGFTTVFSIITTFLAIWKKLENWIYWFAIDLVYVYLYWTRGGYLFVLLFCVYLVMVVVGYLSWKRQYLQVK